MKYIYQDGIWFKNFFTYDPKSRDFLGRRGTKRNFHQVPSVRHLFHLFWPKSMVCKIIIVISFILLMHSTIQRRKKLGTYNKSKIEKNSDNSHIHVDEKTIKYLILLRERWVHFSLSHHLQYCVPQSILGHEEMFSHNKFYIL